MPIKQVPNFTVNIRVPEPIFMKLDAEVRRRKDLGERVSKNSLFIEALELYLYYLEENVEEEGYEQKNEDEQESDDDDTLGAIPRF